MKPGNPMARNKARKFLREIQPRESSKGNIRPGKSLGRNQARDSSVEDLSQKILAVRGVVLTGECRTRATSAKRVVESGQKDFLRETHSLLSRNTAP